MKRLLAAAILVLWPACFVWASVNASGAITASGTFQQVFASNPTRTGCTVQNNGVLANTMWVYAGLAGAATRFTSFQVPGAGAIFSCSTGSGVQTDAIFIDGTTADKFYAEQW